MPNQNNESLQARIDRLEHRVRELEERLESSKVKTDLNTERSKSDLHSKKTVDTQEKKTLEVDRFQPGEEWLNRIGIGLLLIGVAFLFKYSIDQGWLIPPIRSAIGLGVGVVLFGSGLKMKAVDKPLKQILLGGGIAAFYITGFATYQLYSFMPGLVIWLFMIVVTLLALSLSLQQDEAVLSVVGTLGALGTPFMLHSGGGSIPMLMGYLALVLAGTSVVYMQKGWRSLLWSIAVGGFVVICVGIIDVSSLGNKGTASEKWSLQAGALIWATASWVLPVIREVLSLDSPLRWPDPQMLLDDGTIDENMTYRTSSSIHMMVFMVPLFMLTLGYGIWEFTMTQAGIASIVLAVLGSGFFLPLKRKGVSKLASTHALLGLLMLTIGIFLLLEGSFLFTVLVAETVALRYVAHQTGDTKISVSSHILFGILVYWLLSTLFYSGAYDIYIFNVESISELIFIAAGGLLIPMWLRRDDLSQVYRISCHIIFLVWLYQNFSVLENGQAWVTISWGIYAIVLLILGFSRYGKRVRMAGMVTIFLVVGKLFLVDLSQLQAIWRILLFTGFGAIFLIIGYYSQSRWNNGSE